jgi:hypothetical protein
MVNVFIQYDPSFGTVTASIDPDNDSMEGVRWPISDRLHEALIEEISNQRREKNSEKFDLTFELALGMFEMIAMFNREDEKDS